MENNPVRRALNYGIASPSLRSAGQVNEERRSSYRLPCRGAEQSEVTKQSLAETAKS